jgi:hypothetical protein
LDHAIAAAVEKLSAPQRRAWAALAVGRLVRLLCGRQAGKTYLIALWLLGGALLVPASINVYLALTKESAKRAIWPELLAVGRALGIEESCFKLHGGVVTLPNGSTVLVMGTDDKATIESWRGSKLNKVVIDEMGSQPPEWIAYMVRDIVWWCIMRHDGAIALLGTPGLIADGYWFEMTKPAVRGAVGDRGEIVLHEWTVYENPGIPHASAFIDETLQINGWTRETPQFLREVMGQWTADASALVYPYVDAQHGIDALPDHNAEGFIIPASSWHYTLAASVAHHERVAWAVLATNPAIDGVWLVEGDAELSDPDQHAERIAARLEHYRERTPEGRVLCVVDPGELGADHVAAMRVRHRIPVTPVDTAARKSSIRVCRGALMSGAVRPVRVVRGERTRGIRDAWNVLGWDPKRPALHNRTQPEQDQIASAAAFGYRAAPRHVLDPRAHVVGSRAWHENVKASFVQRMTDRERMNGVGRLER